MALLSLMLGMLMMSSLAGHGIDNIWGETETWTDPNTEGVIYHKIYAEDTRPVLCGLRPALWKHVQDRDVDDDLDKLIGGKSTIRGQFPWTVKILAKTMKNGKLKRRLVCGGAIINRYWVLTAAHCLSYGNKSSVSIVVGDFKKNSKGEQKFLVDKYIPHEQFMVSRNGDYDIGLIKVANKKDGRGIRFNYFVQPICLPHYGQTCSRKKSVIATGWGATSPRSNKRVRRLKRILLRCRSNGACRKKIYPGMEISDRMFCAGATNGTRDACEGDIGGPGVLKIGSIFILAGIMSHGTLCPLPNTAVIFSSVSEYLHWIADTINANSDFIERIIPTRPE